MSRTSLPLPVADVSSLAKSLRSQLAERDGLPSHLEMLNILARAAGFRNFQHFRAEAAQMAPVQAQPVGAAGAEPDARDAAQAPAKAPGDAAQAPTADPPASPGRAASAAPVDPARLAKLIRHFDAEGRLTRWPGKFSLRAACLWVMWSRLPAGQAMDEPRVNELLGAAHTFGDHALLRRELFDSGLVTRTPDGREYRRLEKRPTPEALALMKRLDVRTS